MNPRTRALKVAILAAGYSSRLGRSKALAKIMGSTLLRRTLEVVAPLADGGVLVVVPTASSAFRRQISMQRARLLPNAHRARGLASSVHLAVRYAGSASALLLLPVDLARLQRRDLQRLVQRWRGAPARIIVTDSGPHGGSPLILPRRYFPLTRTLEGDTGLRALLSRIPPGEIMRVVLPSAAFDVDTPAELDAARRYWRSGAKLRSSATT